MDVYVYVLSEFEFWRPSTPSQTASAEQKIRHKQVRYRRRLAPIYSVARTSCRCFPYRPLNINMLSDRHFTSQTQSMSTAKLVLELHTVDPVTNSPLWSMRYLVQAPLPARNFFLYLMLNGYMENSN